MNLRKSLVVLLSLLVWTLPETHATGKKSFISEIP